MPRLLVLFITMLIALCAAQTEAMAAPISAAPPPPLFQTLSDTELTAILDLMDESWRHGMNPKIYQTEKLRAGLTAWPPDKSLRMAALFDQSLARYIADLSGMRVRAKDIDLRARDWRQAPKPETALDLFRAAPDKIAFLKNMPPQSALYARLQTELADLRPLLEQGKGHTPIHPLPALHRLLKPGDTHTIVPILRDRMGTKLPDGQNPAGYDDALARAVMNFQRDHNLKPDAMIGPKTVRFFNQTHLARAQQIIANLERLRWLPSEKPAKYIVVNIPAATLWAVMEGATITEMPVIVGRPERPTPQFQTEITGVRFNPTWTVPETILMKDFVPELIKNPDFLTTKGITIWKKDDQGEKIEVSPHDIDWADVTIEELKTYRFIQGAGEHNVLGRIRVIMPNPYDIYLHDTNTPEYFRDDNRTISSGCIRLSRPQEVARFVLHGVPNWDEGKMAKSLSDDVTREVRAEPAFPVILLYQTAWLKNDGNLVVAYDFYNEDIRLYTALKNADIIPDFAK